MPTTTTTTPIDIEAARALATAAQARADAATPGPWGWCIGSQRDGDADVLAPDGSEIATCWPDKATENATFIAAARADVPALSAGLTAALDALEEFQRGSGCVDGYTIGEALARIGVALGRTPTEGIPDAINRMKREIDAMRAHLKRWDTFEVALRSRRATEDNDAAYAALDRVVRMAEEVNRG